MDFMNLIAFVSFNLVFFLWVLRRGCSYWGLLTVKFLKIYNGIPVISADDLDTKINI